MSIASEIQRIKTGISNIYTTLQNQGISVPSNKTIDNLNSTINSTILRTPSNCAGLVMWLDGDCNTRNGLDRSKKYFENLVWMKIGSSIGNQEIQSNNSTNSWNGNMLVVNGYAYYPHFFAGTTNSITIEWVMKKTTDTKGLCGFHLAYQGGYSLHANSSNNVNFYFRDANTNAYISNIHSISLNTTYYICAKYDYSTKKGHLIIPAMNLNQVKDNLIPSSVTSSALAGFGRGSALASDGGGVNSSGATDYSGGGEIGMVRVWTRALSDSEINANYLDAKKRFNCI